MTTAAAASAQDVLSTCLATYDRDCLARYAVQAAQEVADPQGRARALLEIALKEAEGNFLQSARAAMEVAGAVLRQPRTGPGADLAAINDELAGALARAQAALGDFDDAERALVGILATEPRQAAQVEVAKAALEAGEVARADRLMEGLDTARRGALARLYLHAGHLDRALDLADTLGGAAERVRLYQSVAEAMAEAGDAGGAVQLATRYPPAADGVRGAVGSVLGKQGALEAARALAEQINGPDDRGFVLYGIVDTLAGRGEMLAAQALAAEIEDETWRDLAYDAIIVAYMEAGQDANAVAFATQTHDDPWARGQALDLLVLRRQLVRGDVAAGEATRDMITEPFWQVQALLQLARAEVDAGNWTAANASLAAAVRRTDALEAGEQFFVARDLALAEAHAGDADAAVRAIELPGNTMFRVEGFAEAVQELARQGWQDAARAVLARAASQALAIADEGDRTYFAARLAVAGAKIGDATGTAALLAALDPYERATTLADIALNR